MIEDWYSKKPLPSLWWACIGRLWRRWKLEVFVLLYFLFFFVWPFVYDAPEPYMTRTVITDIPAPEYGRP